MTNAVVVHLDEGGDLNQKSFDSIDAAHKYIETIEWKAIMVTGENILTIDRT